MRLRTLAVAATLGLGAALLAPGTAEAAHRHHRYCDHRTHYSGYYERHYAPPVRYYSPRVYYAPPVRYYRSYYGPVYRPYYRPYCPPRSRVGVFLGFGW